MMMIDKAKHILCQMLPDLRYLYAISMHVVSMQALTSSDKFASSAL